MSSIFRSLIGSTLEYIKETKLFIIHCFPADEPNLNVLGDSALKKTVASRHYWSCLLGDSKQFFISCWFVVCIVGSKITCTDSSCPIVLQFLFCDLIYEKVDIIANIINWTNGTEVRIGWWRVMFSI